MTSNFDKDGKVQIVRVTDPALRSPAKSSAESQSTDGAAEPLAAPAATVGLGKDRFNQIVRQIRRDFGRAMTKLSQ